MTLALIAAEAGAHLVETKRTGALGSLSTVRGRTSYSCLEMTTADIDGESQWFRWSGVIVVRVCQWLGPDLLQHLNEHKPHVVHFSGHGSPTEEIILLDKVGNPKPVSKEALASLFRTLKDNIRVVLLNACFSRPQAEAITGEIDCAIGMSRAIGDDAAITFVASFYRALGFGRSVKAAFDQGKTALLLEGIPEEKTPVLTESPSYSSNLACAPLNRTTT